MFSSITVPDLEFVDGRPILVFAENCVPWVPVSTSLDFIKSELHQETISFSAGDLYASGIERMGDDTELPTMGLVAVKTASLTPPASIDLFIQLVDTYATMQDMVFPLCTVTLLDPVFNSGTDRVYSTALFKLPIIGSSGITHAFKQRIFAKLPSSWEDVTGLDLSVAILGHPASSAYVEPEG